MKEKKSCIIIGAAPETSLSFLDRALVARSFVFAADGGYLTAKREGISIDFWIGDMDSAGGRPMESDIPCTVLPCEKDFGDVHTAVNAALSKGIREIYLVGCSGGRVDHYLANLALLEHIANAGGEAVLLDAQNAVRFLHPGTYTVPRDARFSYLSLLALDETVCGVTLSGLKYPLCNATLFRAVPIGISNEWVADEATISIAKGRTLLIFSEDKRNEKT